MTPKNKWFVYSLMLGMILAVINAEAGSTTEKSKEVKIEEIPDSQLKKITFTKRAAERIGIETATVSEQKFKEKNGERKSRLIIPYSAVIYDQNGATWAYINPEPLVFIRHSIDIDRIDDQKVILRKGPPTNSQVVTVGVAEIYGVESGIGK